ncbi:MAG: DUF4440 domain-containing protein [Acidobacteria bacterium]|nr:DUF4440 domain-containing protein [Acidobacteriota bacterium]
MSQLSESAKLTITALQQRWIDCELAEDLTGVLALCTDDVVWLPPNEPALLGKQKVAAWPGSPQGNRIRRIEITNLQIDGSNGLAYKLADFATWLDTPGKPDDEPVTGSHLWVLREVSPDDWRVALVAWSIAAQNTWRSD